MAKDAGQLLLEAAELYAQRNKQYGPSYFTHGPVCAALFPNGVVLRTAEDFARWGAFNLIVTKLVRYANNFDKGGHSDSASDLAVYAKILEELDARISDGSLPRAGRLYREQFPQGRDQDQHPASRTDEPG